MKRVFALIIAALMLVFSFVACSEKEDEADLDKIDENYSSRTAAFYGRINKNCFYSRMKITVNGETYFFTQATNGTNVTTITDFEGTDRDTYKIFEKNVKKRCVHTLNMEKLTYDTLITDNGQDLLLADYTPDMFSEPTAKGEAEFEGKTYYCEVFDTASEGSDEITGQDIYYFNEGKVVAIEMKTNGQSTMTIVFEEYYNKIPESIYVTIPEGYKGGTIQNEVIVDWSQIWEENSWGM